MEYFIKQKKGLKGVYAEQSMNKFSDTCREVRKPTNDNVDLWSWNHVMQRIQGIAHQSHKHHAPFSQSGATMIYSWSLEFLPRADLAPASKLPQVKGRERSEFWIVSLLFTLLLYLTPFNLYPNHCVRLWKMAPVSFRVISKPIMWHLYKQSKHIL